MMVAIVPREQATIIDNWRVAGLRGSGSFDFRLDEVFVPAELTFERAASACRGGALFNVEAHVFLSNELPPLMTGMARRALGEMAGLAGQTRGSRRPRAGGPPGVPRRTRPGGDQAAGGQGSAPGSGRGDLGGRPGRRGAAATCTPT